MYIFVELDSYSKSVMPRKKFPGQLTKFETQLIKLLRGIPAAISVGFNDNIQRRTLCPTLGKERPCRPRWWAWWGLRILASISEMYGEPDRSPSKRLRRNMWKVRTEIQEVVIGAQSLGMTLALVEILPASHHRHRSPSFVTMVPVW